MQSLGWRVAFASLGVLLAHQVAGPTDHAPWLLAAGLLGFQLGKFLGPLVSSALAQLDPPRRPPQDDDERQTQP